MKIMANIIHAEIVGTRMSENGSAGYIINYTSYSVLLFFSDGTRNLIEGDADQIRPFLPFMSPHIDDRKLNIILEQFEGKIKQDLQYLVKNALVEFNNPIPKGIIGKHKKEAKDILEKAGFRVEFSFHTPDFMDGTVKECERKEKDLMTVILKIQYDVPEVRGLNKDEAQSILQKAGFSSIIKRKICEREKQDTVLDAEHSDDSLEITLHVAEVRSKELEFIRLSQNSSTINDVWKYWESSGLGEVYPNANEIIAREKRSEDKFGKKTTAQVDSIKNTLQKLLLD